MSPLKALGSIAQLCSHLTVYMGSYYSLTGARTYSDQYISVHACGLPMTKRQIDPGQLDMPLGTGHLSLCTCQLRNQLQARLTNLPSHLRAISHHCNVANIACNRPAAPPTMSLPWKTTESTVKPALVPT